MTKKQESWALKAVRARTSRDPEDLLRELYVRDLRSQQEIADALGVSRSLVSKWLADFAINRPEKPPLEPLMSA